jgi:esterase/lipase
VDSLVSKLNDLAEKKPRNFYVYAESLGTSLALLLVSKVSMKKTVLITPGDDLADCFWKSVEANALKVKMEKNGMTLKKLKQIWSAFSPTGYLNEKAIKTKYYIKLASNDTTVPFENGLKLVKLLKRKNVEYDVNNIPHIKHKDGIPHRLTIWKECCIFPKGSLKFIID